MKIQLIEQGYDQFNGEFGTVQFVNGISVSDVTDAQARFFASLIKVRCVDDGSDPGANAQFLRAMNTPAVTFDLPTQAELDAKNAPQAPEAPAPVAYTREQLEEIADKEGIKGLRKVGDEFGVKSTDIKKLINAIMLSQQTGVAPAEHAEG